MKGVYFLNAWNHEQSTCSMDNRDNKYGDHLWTYLEELVNHEPSIDSKEQNNLYRTLTEKGVLTKKGVDVNGLVKQPASVHIILTITAIR